MIKRLVCLGALVCVLGGCSLSDALQKPEAKEVFDKVWDAAGDKLYPILIQAVEKAEEEVKK